MEYNLAYHQFEDRPYLGKNSRDTDTPAELVLYDINSIKNISNLKDLSSAQRKIVNFFDQERNKRILEDHFQSEKSLESVGKFLELEAGTYQKHKSNYGHLAEIKISTPEIVFIEFCNQDFAKRAANILTQNLFFILHLINGSITKVILL